MFGCTLFNTLSAHTSVDGVHPGLFIQETRKRICSRTLVDSDKVSELLDAIETTIRLDPSNYHKIVEALEKDSSMQHLCGKLKSTCGECYHLPHQSAPLEEPVSIVDLSKVPDGTLGDECV